MGDRVNLSTGSGIGEREMSSEVDSAQLDSSPPNSQNPNDVMRKEWSRLMKMSDQECHPAGRKTKKRSAPHDNRRQKNVHPNDPRNDLKKKLRMGGRRCDRMDEKRKPPLKRGRESCNL